MRIVMFAGFSLALCASQVALAQSTARIDLNAKARSLTYKEYEALVACTLERHPDETKRFARYYYERREKQTWQENEKDPDSGLLMPSFEGCIEFVSGEPVPFSLGAVIQRWAVAHSILQVP